MFVREALDADADGLIELIRGCFAEYPGCLLDVEGEAPELRAIRSWFSAHGGRFHVGEREGRVVASVGFVPAGEGVELKKLYVEKSERRTGLGSRLVALVEEQAEARGARFVELWSDTRFTDAHRLYERLGYRRGPRTRELHDLSRTVEFHYRKDLPPPPARVSREVRP